MRTIIEEILSTFEQFVRLRQDEIEDLNIYKKMNGVDVKCLNEIRHSWRVSQAKHYAHLQHFKTYELYEFLQELYDDEQIDKYKTFVGFVICERGLPTNSHGWHEKPEISDELIQWLFRHHRSLREIDLSFSDFEEAYKEACWRDLCESLMMTQ